MCTGGYRLAYSNSFVRDKEQYGAFSPGALLVFQSVQVGLTQCSRLECFQGLVHERIKS